jgi:hypothetical protein
MTGDRAVLVLLVLAVALLAFVVADLRKRVLFPARSSAAPENAAAAAVVDEEPPTLGALP